MKVCTLNFIKMFTVNTSLHIFCIVNFLLKNTQQQNC